MNVFLVTICDMAGNELARFPIRTSAPLNVISFKTVQICKDLGWNVTADVELVPEFNKEVLAQQLEQLGEPDYAPALKIPFIKIMEPVGSTSVPFTNCLFPPDNAYTGG